MKNLLVLLVVILLVPLAGCSKAENVLGRSAPAREKSAAPDILVTSLDKGTPLKLSQLRGKVVFLNFWATWCPPCREEIPSMVRLNKAMAGKPFQMVAVSIDEGGAPAVKSFLAFGSFDLPVYLDSNTKEAAKVFGITGVPETFIIDKNGIIVKKVIGPLEWNSPEVISYLNGLMK